MASLNSRALTYSESLNRGEIPNIRNCYRCGKDFFLYLHMHRDAKICKACRTPQVSMIVSKPSLLGKPLNLREEQITKMVSEGLTNKEIGNNLHVAEGSIKVFMWRILAKTGFENRTKLAVWWALKSDNSSQTA